MPQDKHAGMYASRCVDSDGCEFAWVVVLGTTHLYASGLWLGPRVCVRIAWKCVGTSTSICIDMYLRVRAPFRLGMGRPLGAGMGG